jgi:hypothetical protein
MAPGPGAFFDAAKDVVSNNPVVNSAIISVLSGSMTYLPVAAVLIYHDESREWRGRISGVLIGVCPAGYFRGPDARKVF